MIKKILAYLYKKYPQEYSQLLVEDFFGSIPENIKAPSLDFLLNRKADLERFFTIQAYHIQKKAVGDVKNHAFYMGQLLTLKAFIVSLSKEARILAEPITEEKKDESPNIVSDFVKGFSDFFNGSPGVDKK